MMRCSLIFLAGDQAEAPEGSPTQHIELKTALSGVRAAQQASQDKKPHAIEC